MYKNKSGFTIVELLIVIVVIAILASITVVAYNGIQGRANDVVVQSDLNAIGKKIEMYRIDNGDFPGSISSYSKGEYRLKFSGGSYIDAAYCTNDFKAVVAGTSKSGQGFAYDTTTGNVYKVTGNAGACSTFGVVSGVDGSSISTVLNKTTGAWSSYVDH